MPPPSVAVIIPTHNRKEQLTRCVRSLLQQAYSNFLVVVIDDASTPPVSATWFDSDPKVFVLRNTQNRKQSASRNLGIRSTPADFYVLIDDDCSVEDPFWIRKHVELHETHGGSLMGGRINNRTHRIWGSARAVLTRNGLQYGNFLQTMNLSFSRTTFDRLGGFNETFAELEDVDFSQRAKRAGVRLLYSDSLEIQHEFDDRFLAILKRNFQYGQWTVPVRKLQKFDGHWILPGSLVASLLYYLPLSLVSTVAQTLLAARDKPAAIFAAPLILCYTLCHSAGMIRYFWDHRAWHAKA